MTKQIEIGQFHQMAASGKLTITDYNLSSSAVQQLVYRVGCEAEVIACCAGPSSCGLRLQIRSHEEIAFRSIYPMVKSKSN